MLQGELLVQAAMKLSDQNAIIAEQSKQIENLKQDISYL
jgi:hypothetical protein